MQITILAVLTNDAHDANAVQTKLHQAADVITDVHAGKSEAIVIQYEGELSATWTKLRQSVTSLAPKSKRR